MHTIDFSHSTVEREPLYAQVARQILQYIIENNLPAGARLPSERKLSEQFGVSRVVIREAMKVLIRDGVIGIQPGRAAIVTDGTRAALHQSLDLLYRVRNLDISMIWEVRTTLETRIARLAALNANTDDITLLESCIEEMVQSIADLERHVSADEKFHFALASMTGNTLYEALVQSLVLFLKDARRMTAGMPDAAYKAVESHTRILEAIRDHDADRAEREIRVHLEEAARILDAALAAQKDSAGQPRASAVREDL